MAHATMLTRTLIRTTRVMLVAVLGLLGACATGPAAQKPAPDTGPASATPKYVFLFIGDGMGPVQRRVADLAARQTTGQPMRMQRLPVNGQIHTRAANTEITDSAAAATAMAAGVKANNGALLVTPDGTPVQPITTALAQRAGWKIGVLTSVQLNHATPAGFFATSPKRSSYDQIAAQVADSDVHLLVGNGLLSESGKQQEIMASWQEQGLAVVTTVADAAAAPAGQRVVAVLKFPSAHEEKLDPAAGPGELANAVAMAIKRLDNPQGFFLMVEGGKVDTAGHANAAGRAIDETHALDRAVEVAFEFYRQRPQHTLIVVTADHETGGMGVDETRLNLPRLFQLTTLEPRLVEALGAPESITAESAVQAAQRTLGLAALTAEEKASIETAAAIDLKTRKAQTVRAAMKVAQARVGITWTTGGHTPVDVPVTAIGAGAESFAGVYDNTEIYTKLISLCLPNHPPARAPAGSDSSANSDSSARGNPPRRRGGGNGLRLPHPRR